ncbi:hypothetical protein GCM10007079_27390 [Nocardiopsis terrae]|uniref:hypothetical protein n=1 Tax=Nocardiopsis terrae TaxID=372655 RepID=UPI00174CE35F|nr:hypothetical protein [Nocardiopsis terrae]GHC84927.1 hypothetical protein GCM10007079_27390 [Nocardiopsis terrae]
MTVTVIIIIAVIVVLAVLVLLLLGMRALSLGSREDDYDDEYEYDDVEDSGPDDRRDRGEGPEDEEAAPRSRSRRSRQGGGRAERRPKGRRQRGVDWEDGPEELSDNDFWSSLSDEDTDRPEPGRRGDVGGYADDEYDDGYDDREETAGRDPFEQGPPSGPNALPSAPGASGTPGAGAGSTADLAMLASLGQGSAPAQPEPAPRHAEQWPSEPGARAGDTGARPSGADPGQSALSSSQGLPPTQGLPPVQPAAPQAASDDDPLGPGSWSPRPPSTGDPFEGREPLRPAERRDPLAADSPGGPPLSGGERPPYESGSMNRSDYPSLSGTERSVSADPLDPGFRPGPPGEGGPGSPIWSSMDTGAHQRPDLSSTGGYGSGPDTGSGGPPFPDTGARPATGQPMGGPNMPGHPLPGDAAPRTGGYPAGSFRSEPAYGTDPFARPAYDTGTHQRSPYDSGTHTRPDYPSGPPNTPSRPEYDTGQHTRPTYDTDPFARPAYDTGTHQRNPYDSGTHTRPDYLSGPVGPNVPGGGPGAQGSDQWWGVQDDTGTFGAASRPTMPGGGQAPDQSSPFGHGPGPLSQNGPGQGGPGYPGAPGHPTGGYQSGQFSGDLPTAYPGHTQQSDPYGHPVNPGGQGTPPGGGYSDVLSGGFAPQSPEPDYGYPPLEGWQPRGEEAEGPGGPGQRHGNGPYGQESYGQDPYGRPAPGRDYYEGGYEDGRFR